uniref:Uncharacterized protein n=1 Tax=Oryza brachyantha TaxID=4533 RepID=J3NAP9_ORYBR
MDAHMIRFGHCVDTTVIYILTVMLLSQLRLRRANILSSICSRSRYSISPELMQVGDNDNYTSLGVNPEHLNKLPSWIKNRPVHQMHDIMKQVKNDSVEFKKVSSESVLKKTFEEEINPFFALDYYRLDDIPDGEKKDYVKSLLSEQIISNVDGIATVASVIWKYGWPLEYQIIIDLPCNNSEQGAALFCSYVRGRDLDIDKLNVVTDNEKNYSIMVGKEIFIKVKVRKPACHFCSNCRWVPREMISHVNDIAKRAFLFEFDTMEAEITSLLGHALSAHQPVLR